MSSEKLRIRASEDVWIDIDDLEELPSLDHQKIYIERSSFRDAMSVNMVAVTIGVSVRQLRRMIEAGDFPPSNLMKGQRHFWARQTVRSWKHHQHRSSERRSSKARSAGQWTDPFAIESEQEREFLRKGTDTQILLKEVREMGRLFADDPAEFARRHPKLRRWLREKGMR